MTTTGLVGHGYCTRCGTALVEGFCPIHDLRPDALLSASSQTGPAVLGNRTGRAPARPLLVVVALVSLIATGLATAGLMQNAHTSRLLATTNQELRDSNRQQKALRQQLADLTAAHRQLKTSVTNIQDVLAARPDAAATVKKAARSVFTVITAAGTGSGWVVSSGAGESKIVTNFHVVADGYVNGDRTVTIRRGQLSYPGHVVDASQSNDLALISVNQSLPALPVRTSRPAIGDPLLVLGSPLGLGGTVTSGIASAYRRDQGLSYLQFSAPISPGNSGGPVIDQRGRVVAVTVAKMIGDGAEGLGFAIPASRLCSALEVC